MADTNPIIHVLALPNFRSLERHDSPTGHLWQATAIGAHQQDYVSGNGTTAEQACIQLLMTLQTTSAR